ncbi:hypothetical protein SESBI_33774 [Sesbania bispinosa]|nr:hypothetical protein SESBI_33774 [Sesbania bispinosa]
MAAAVLHCRDQSRLWPPLRSPDLCVTAATPRCATVATSSLRHTTTIESSSSHSLSFFHDPSPSLIMKNTER